jgi:peptidoglycan/LPS O-acetylase OafA/YrhL
MGRIRQGVFLRIKELDGLRGIASAQVVMSHGAIFPAMIGTAIDGASAVILFFVLSGFVLSAPYFAGLEFRLTDFYVRRVFRIYPAAIASLVFATMLGFRTDLADFIHQAALIWPGQSYTSTNNVLWSLVIEMRMSIVMPAIILLLSGRRYSALLGVTFLIIAARIQPDLRFWIPVFGIGAVLARALPYLSGRLPQSISWAIFALSIAGYFAAAFHPGVTSYPAYVALVASSSVGLIFCAIEIPSVRHLLISRAAIMLGSLSYGIYLFHYPIYKFFNGLDGRHALVVFLTVGCTFGIASICYGLIEKPMIKIGRALAVRSSWATSGWRTNQPVRS